MRSGPSLGRRCSHRCVRAAELSGALLQKGVGSSLQALPDLPVGGYALARRRHPTYRGGSKSAATDAPSQAQRLLDWCRTWPRPLGSATNLMRARLLSSNSLISWLIVRSGLVAETIQPPVGPASVETFASWLRTPEDASGFSPVDPPHRQKSLVSRIKPLADPSAPGVYGLSRKGGYSSVTKMNA